MNCSKYVYEIVHEVLSVLTNISFNEHFTFWRIKLIVPIKDQSDLLESMLFQAFTDIHPSGNLRILIFSTLLPPQLAFFS